MLMQISKAAILIPMRQRRLNQDFLWLHTRIYHLSADLMNRQRRLNESL